MKTVKEIREALQLLWDEYNTIKEKAVTEERDLTSEEADRSEEIFTLMDKTKRELAIAEKEYEVNGYMAPNEAAVIPKEEIPQEGAGKWNSMGEYLQAVIRASLPIGDMVDGRPTGVADRRLVRMSNELITEERATGMGEDLPQFGGYLVQTDFSNELITLAHNTGILVNKTRKIPISKKSNSIKINGIDETSRTAGNRWGGIQVYWLEEAGTKTATKPKFRQIQLGLNKAIGMVYLTDEVLEDTATLESVVRQGFGEEFAFVLDDSVINGTGVGQPLGILNSNCLVSVTKETGQAATTFLAENAEKMFSRLSPSSISKAVWYINQDVWPQIYQLHHAVGTGGVSMFIPAGEISKSPFGTLMGRPIQPIEQCQTLGTKGDVYLADLSQYLTADKGAMQSAMSIHVRFINDETVIRFVYRFDGQPVLASTLTPAHGSNTVSPFVALNART